MTATHVPSPGTVGAWAWVLIGVYIAYVLVVEVVKTVRTARRERRQTRQFSDAVADPGTWELVSALPVEARFARFDDLVGKSIGIRVDDGEMQSTTLVSVAYLPGHAPDRGVMLTVSPSVIARRTDGPHRFALDHVRRY